MLTTSTAIAGAELKPGDFIPATSKNPFTSLASPIMKSGLSAIARSPAKFLIFSLKLTLLVVFKETSLTLANPSYSVETESLSQVSIASGPTNKFP